VKVDSRKAVISERENLGAKVAVKREVDVEESETESSHPCPEAEDVAKREPIVSSRRGT